MANPIRRIVQLVLDRAAAARMEAEARRSLGTVESGLNRLESTAKRVGAALAGFLSLRALFRVGEALVKNAAEADAVWSDLAGTIDNTGASFAAMEKDLNALGAAFQDATINSDEDFAAGLSRLVSLTGNVSASINNMGLVANVAAKFFRGDLSSATELVGKVMNGNITLLQRMGIKVKDAQEGLDVLAKRSFGAAEKAAGTFAGRMAQVNNLWGEFKEQLGAAVISSGSATNGVEMLRNALKDMITWVMQNRAAIQQWITSGINAAIISMRTLLGVVQDYLRLKGLMSFGGVAFTPANTAKGIEAQMASLDRQRAQAVQEQAAALKALEAQQKKLQLMGPLNPELLKLNTDLQVANDLLQRIDDNAATARAALEQLKNPIKGLGGLNFNAPGQLSGNGTGPRLSPGLDKNFKLGTKQTEFDMAIAATRVATALPEATGALNAFGQQQASAVTMSALLGREFDALGVEADNVAQLLNDLAVGGMQENDPIMQAYLERLREIQHQMKLNQEEAQLMADISTLAGQVVGASLDGGLGPFARIKAKVNLIRAAEETAEGIAAAFSLFGAVNAPGHFAAAARFVGIAGAWAAIGGGVGGGAPGGSGGGSLAGARGAASQDSRDAKPSTQMAVYLVGPGFDALNPRVQKVVRGTIQEIQELHGNNTTIRQVRSL